MRTSSSKAKGRRLQQDIVADILKMFPELESDDVTSRSMGCPGEDILLSPKARKLLPICIEAKNVEANKKIYDWYEQATYNAEPYEPIVVMHKNRSKTLAVLDFEGLLVLFRLIALQRNIIQEGINEEDEDNGNED